MKKNTTAPTLNEFEIFFQELYKCNNSTELLEIMNIQSDVNIPILDSSISEDEIKVAFKAMKKSGYDFSIPVLKALVASFSLLLAIIFNIMLFVKYPASLACSLLSFIPKSGILKLARNFRGIQMLKSLACLYDRVIANHLKLWASFNINQTTFQRGKSTLLHIFTFRILIGISKKMKIPLYIATMDIEKAFNHDPRSLRKLVTLGIGKCMLFALKQICIFSML